MTSKWKFKVIGSKRGEKKKEKEEGGVVPMGERRLHGSNLITLRKMVKQEEI